MIYLHYVILVTKSVLYFVKPTVTIKHKRKKYHAAAREIERSCSCSNQNENKIKCTLLSFVIPLIFTLKFEIKTEKNAILVQYYPTSKRRIHVYMYLTVLRCTNAFC